MAAESGNTGGRFRSYLIYGGLAIAMAVVIYGSVPGPHPLQGQAAPKASVLDFEGNAVDLSASIGKEVVLLNFWASWCPPCRLELPEIEKLAKEYADTPGVEVIAVSLDASPPAAKEVAAELDPALRVYWGDGTITSTYGISGIPATLVIGKDGVVRRVFSGYSEEMTGEIRALLDGLLAEG